MALTNYNFSSDYQDELLATMIRMPDLFIGLDGVIQYGYFTGSNSQIICKLLLEFYKKHSTFPTPAQLSTEAQNHARKSGNNEQATELTSYIQRLSETEVRAPTSYRDEAIQFAKTRACIIAATEVARTIQENKELTYDIPKKFQEALSIGQNIYDLGYCAHADVDVVIDKLTNQKYGIYTGFELIDTHVFRKGMGPGWLIVPLAPPKAYKTGFCLNMAVNMVSPNLAYDVLYYACEISSELALLRAYQRIANRTKDQFDDDPEEFRAAVKRGVLTKLAGSLFVKHFPAGSVTISDIRAHALQTIQVNKLQNVKAIFIDYAETVKYDGDKDAPEHRKQSSIYKSARALGDELGCAIIMPDRCNRETVDKAVPDRNSFQGAIEKGGILDVGIGLCQTPEERQQNKMRYYIFLNRHGEEGIHIRGKVDPKQMVLTMDEMLSWQETANIEDNAARQREERRQGKNKSKNNKDKAALDERLNEDEAGQNAPRASRRGPRNYEV